MNRAGNEILRKIEYLFHALVLLLLMGAFLPFIRNKLGNQPGVLEGDPLQRTILTLVYLLALLVLCFQMKKVLIVIAATPAVWLLLLWATLSVLWSDFPDIAFRRVLAIWLTSLYGLLLYLRFEFRQLLRLLGTCLLIVMVSSLIWLVVFPEWAVMGPPLLGKWRGVFIHKTHLGRFSALAFLVTGYLIVQNKRTRKKIFWGLGMMISLITLVGSQSLSALLIVVVMFLSALFIKIICKWKKLMALWLILFFIISGNVASLFVANHERILADTFNKDATLSGRVPLWQMLIDKACGKPLLGYGYGSFWMGTEGPAADVWKKLNWEVPHAHNGYLDLWLQLGLPGVCLGVCLLLLIFTLSVKHLFQTGLAGQFWTFLMIYFIGYNWIESVMLVANSLFLVLLVYGYVFLKDRCLPLEIEEAENVQPILPGE